MWKWGSAPRSIFLRSGRHLHKIDSLFTKDGVPALSTTVFPIPVFNDAEKEEQNKKITATEFAQPSIGTLSLGFYKLLQNAGFKPDFTAGHSFGELTALWAAGVYSDDDFLFLAKSRGKAMAPLSDPNFDAGTMLAVKGDIEKVEGSDIKTFSRGRSCKPELKFSRSFLLDQNRQLQKFKKHWLIKGIPSFPWMFQLLFTLRWSGMRKNHLQPRFKKRNSRNPKSLYSQIPPESNTRLIRQQIQQTLTGHILNPVNFKDEIEAIYEAGGSIFIEIGPKSVLTNLVNNILDGKPHAAVALNPNAKKDSARQFREAVTQLCVLGLELQNFDPYRPSGKGTARSKEICDQCEIKWRALPCRKNQNCLSKCDQ